MSAFASEALFTGIKEGAKLSLCIFIVLSYVNTIQRNYLRKPFFAGIGLVMIASFVALTTQPTPEVRDVIIKMVGYVFASFYLFSLGALYHVTGTDMLGPFKKAFFRKEFLISLVFVMTCIYFIPDMTGSSIFLADLSLMSENATLIFLSAGIGFFSALLLSYFSLKRIRMNVVMMFGLPQVFLFLSLIKLFGGGVKGFAELSLIPSVQSGLMKLIHDMVHQLLITLLVPDHPLLKVTTWNFIGIFFGNTIALWLSLIILIVPLVIFIRKHFTAAIIVPQETAPGAVRRKFIKAVRDERVLKSIPVVVFMVFIASTWFVEKGESLSRLYNPVPVPVVADKGEIIIPIKTPGADLLDGMLHKYSVTVDTEDVRIIIMKKSDGTLSVCLDACEICPPDGYAQGEEHVICLYCQTPIPVDTLGRPGGCNPIPIEALVTEKEVKIEISTIMEKWNLVKTGKTREHIKNE